MPEAMSKLTADTRAERDRRKQEKEESERRKAEEERLEAERLAAEKASEQADGGSNSKSKGRSKNGGRLGYTGGTAQEAREREAQGLTPEQRLRLDRERRARAAEERIKRMQEEQS